MKSLIFLKLGNQSGKKAKGMIPKEGIQNILTRVTAFLIAQVNTKAIKEINIFWWRDQLWILKIKFWNHNIYQGFGFSAFSALWLLYFIPNRRIFRAGDQQFCHLKSFCMIHRVPWIGIFRIQALVSVYGVTPSQKTDGVLLLASWQGMFSSLPLWEDGVIVDIHVFSFWLLRIVLLHKEEASLRATCSQKSPQIGSRRKDWCKHLGCTLPSSEKIHPLNGFSGNGSMLSKRSKSFCTSVTGNKGRQNWSEWRTQAWWVYS